MDYQVDGFSVLPIINLQGSTLSKRFPGRIIIINLYNNNNIYNCQLLQFLNFETIAPWRNRIKYLYIQRIEYDKKKKNRYEGFHTALFTNLRCPSSSLT